MAARKLNWHIAWRIQACLDLVSFTHWYVSWRSNNWRARARILLCMHAVLTRRRYLIDFFKILFDDRSPSHLHRSPTMSELVAAADVQNTIFQAPAGVVGNKLMWIAAIYDYMSRKYGDLKSLCKTAKSLLQHLWALIPHAVSLPHLSGQLWLRSYICFVYLVDWVSG